MELNLGQWVVIGICAILIAGYIFGYYYNRQRAGQVLTWLHKGLTNWGQMAASEKLPGMATGGRLEIKQAAAPFRRLEVVYLLAPRDNLLFWLFYRLQGRNDEMVVWITYHSRPGQIIEVARQGDRQFEKRLKDQDKPPLSVLEGSHTLQIAAEKKEGTNLSAKVQSIVQRYQSSVIRLSLRPEKPHLFLRVNLKVMRSKSATDFFSELSDLGRPD